MVYILITLAVISCLVLYAIGEFVVWIVTDFRKILINRLK